GFESHPLRQIRKTPRNGAFCVGGERGADESASKTKAACAALVTVIPASCSELVGAGQADHIAMIVEIAIHAACTQQRWIGKLDTGLADELMLIAQVERQVIGRLVTDAKAEQSTCSVRDAWVAADDVRRSVVIADAGAQSPLGIQLVITTHGVHPAVLVGLWQVDDLLTVGFELQVREARPVGPLGGSREAELIVDHMQPVKTGERRSIEFGAGRTTRRIQCRATKQRCQSQQADAGCTAIKIVSAGQRLLDARVIAEPKAVLRGRLPLESREITER